MHFDSDVMMREALVSSTEAWSINLLTSTKLIVIFLLAGTSTFAFFRLYPKLQGIENRGGANGSSVTANVSLNRQAVVVKIVSLFTDKKAQQVGRFSRFSLARPTDEYFPKDFQLSHYASDEFLKKYLAIAPSLRKDDIYLYDFSDADNSDSYWFS